MLAQIRGTVLEKGSFRAVVDIAGFGLEVQLSKKGLLLCGDGQEITLQTHVQYSDKGPTLFGFADKLEKNIFLKLLSVRGIGGKIALQILQNLSAESVIQAVTLGDISALVATPGIGKKTAERISFELREKISENLPESKEMILTPRSDADITFVLEALESLGFTRQETSEAVNIIIEQRGSIEGIEEERLIMLVLQQLNGR